MMAASPGQDPDWDVLRRGASKSEIDRELGRPATIVRRSWGDEATYQFVTNSEPNYWRAGGYAVLDLLTAFIAEFFLTPAESMNALSGEHYTVSVIYDLNERVRRYTVTKRDPQVKEASDVLTLGVGRK